MSVSQELQGKEVMDGAKEDQEGSGSSSDDATQTGVTISLQGVVVQDQGHLQSIMHAIGVTTLRQRTNDVFAFDHLREGASYTPGPMVVLPSLRSRKGNGACLVLRGTRLARNCTVYLSKCEGLLPKGTLLCGSV